MTWTNVVVVARDQVPEDVRSRVIGETEVTMQGVTRDRRHVVLVDQSAPCQVPGVSGDLLSPELFSDCRVTSVGTNEQITRLAGAIGEMSCDLACVLVYVGKGLILMIVIIAKS
ncbi:hypothetical protein D3C86_1337420 [compost metagenome]